MCYNYENIIYKKDFRGFINKYRLRVGDRQNDWEAFKERFNFYYANGFEHKELPVITMAAPDELQFFHWGLIPHWIKTKKEADVIRKQTLNARCETIFNLPSFGGYIKTQRCLIPATGFFEWREVNGKKYPYHITVKDDDIRDNSRQFSFGGIYSTWIDKDTGEVINTFSIITTPANPLMEIIHNSKKRMPLILRKEDEQLWLSPVLDEKEINALMVPYPDKLITAHTISKLITAKGVDRNVQKVIAPANYDGIEPMLQG